MQPAPALVATILIIEDNQESRELLAILLRGRGYNVLEAEDGLQGFLKAISQYPDLVITDLALPGMDGVETSRRILAMPKLSDTPIFVLSGYLTPEVEAEVLAAGCVGAFSKPFTPAMLLEQVRIALITRRGNESAKRCAAQAQLKGYIRVS